MLALWGLLPLFRRILWWFHFYNFGTVLFWMVGLALRLGCLLVPFLCWFLGLAVMQTDLLRLLWNFVPYCLAFVLFLPHVNRGTNIPALAEAMGLADLLPHNRRYNLWPVRPLEPEGQGDRQERDA